MASKSVEHSLLRIRSRAGVGRTWAMCHALLLGGTDDDVFSLAETLYRREAMRLGWDDNDQIRSYPNFKNYIQKLAENGIECAKDESGVWHSRLVR